MITLTDDQRAVIAHMVMDPDKWVADAIAGRRQHMANTFHRLSPEAQEKIAIAQVQADIVAKVENRRPEYDAARAAEGTNYLNRSQRQAIEDENLRVQREKDLEESRARVAAERKALKDAIRAEILAELGTPQQRQG